MTERGDLIDGNSQREAVTAIGDIQEVTLVDKTGVAVSLGAGGGGTQYADGTTQATPTGNAILWKDGSNVVHVPSTANPLPVQQGNLTAALDTVTVVGPSSANVALDGTDATGVTVPTGATGLRGWLSGIYNQLKNGTSTVFVGGGHASIDAGSNLIGKVSTDQTTHGTTDQVAADITKVGGTTIVAGQAHAAASLPVVLADDKNSPTNMQAVGGTTVVTGGVSGLLGVAGNVASGAADSANPVKVGGVYTTSAPTLTTGQRGDLQLDANANLKVTIPSGTVTANIGTTNGLAADGTDSTATGATQATSGVGIRGWLSTLVSLFRTGSAGSQLADATTPANRASIAAFHNADNQAAASFGYGLLTGGVAQLKNAIGNLDRQSETGVDGVSALGIATGAQQLGSPFATTSTTTVTSGSTVITPAAMSGTNRGAAWSIQVGSTLVVGAGATLETVVVTAVTTTTFTAVFAKAHSGTWAISGYVYNQARDATTADGSTGQGFSANSTFLFNGALNAGSGGWESERSAAGELDGASGTGTNIAAEYEFNGGGPTGAYVNSLPTNAFDRARNLQGKGRMVNTSITTTVATNTSVVFPSAAATATVLPGSPLTLHIPGSPPTAVETVYTTATWVPGSSATVPLQSAVQTGGQTAVAWDSYAVNGPALSGFTPTGLGIEEEALYDPVSGLYYIERSATQDGVSGQNVALEGIGLYNGTTFDRLKGTNGAANVTGPATAATVPSGAFYAGLNPQTALPAAATAGNLTGMLGDKFGRPVMLTGTVRDLRGSQTTTITNTTTETTIVSQAASVYNDLVALIITNTSAVGTRVDLRDTTAGAVIGSLYLPATDTRGFAIPGESLPQTSVNTNWTITCATAVTDVRVFAIFDKNR